MNAADITVGIGPLGYVRRSGKPGVLTADQVKAAFKAQGTPIAQWADDHGYRRCEVYRVLAGRSPCLRGQTHEIAISLGIKPAPDGGMTQ